MPRYLGVYADVSAFANDLDLSKEELFFLVRSREKFYKTRYKDKPDGSKRELSIPVGKLKEVQRKIHKIFITHGKYGEFSHYGIRTKSNVTNAVIHKGSRYLLTLDLKSFFPSVDEKKIYSALTCQLNCRPPIAEIITSLTTYKDQLPQGAPASTDIANFVTLKLQKRLSILANDWGLKFTIYADDITISGKMLNSKFINLVKLIIRDEGFELKNEKEAVTDKSKIQNVTGINIAHNLSVTFKNKIWKSELIKAHCDYGLGVINKEQLDKITRRYDSRKVYEAYVKKVNRLKKL